jgi:hypothetical protein
MFPELLETAKEAERDQQATTGAVERTRQVLQRARAAEAKPTAALTCGRCGSVDAWEDGLCRQCDAQLYTLSAQELWLAVGISAAAFANFAIGGGTGLVLDFSRGYALRNGELMVDAIPLVLVALTVVIGGALAVLLGALSMRRRAERDELREERSAELHERLLAESRAAAELVETCTRDHEAAKRFVEPARTRFEKARAALEAAKEQARSAYEAANPWPRLPPGIASEASFTSFQGIVRRRDEGWGYGSSPIDVAGTVHQHPVDVRGLAEAPSTGAVPS